MLERVRAMQGDPTALSLTVMDEAPVDVPEVLRFLCRVNLAQLDMILRLAEAIDEVGEGG
jgi:hypothetical protein